MGRFLLKNKLKYEDLFNPNIDRQIFNIVTLGNGINLQLKIDNKKLKYDNKILDYGDMYYYYKTLNNVKTNWYDKYGELSSVTFKKNDLFLIMNFLNNIDLDDPNSLKLEIKYSEQSNNKGKSDIWNIEEIKEFNMPNNDSIIKIHIEKGNKTKENEFFSPTFYLSNTAFQWLFECFKNAYIKYLTNIPEETERQIVNKTLSSVKEMDPELNNLTDIIDFKEQEEKINPEPIEETKEQEKEEDMKTLEELQNLKTPNTFSEATDFGELIRILDKEMFFTIWITDISTGRIESSEKFEFKDLEGKPVEIKRTSDFINLLHQYADNNSNFEGWKLRLQQLYNQFNEYTSIKKNDIKKKELKDFNEFVENEKVNKIKLVEYLDKGDGFKFTKWLLQSNKYSGSIETLKYSLMSEPINELNKLREEYLNN
jgi:hypothetical protein